MERIRGDLPAIAVGLIAAVVVAAAIDGREFLRDRGISLAYGQADSSSLVIFILVVGSTLVFTAVVLTALAWADNADRKALFVLVAVPLSLFACLPMYWYVYRDAPPGWHLNIAEEHRFAQPAGVVAALVAYGVAHLVMTAFRNRAARKCRT